MGKTWFGIVALLCSELSFFAPSPGEGNGTPLQYSCLENPMDREEPGRLQSTGSLGVGHDWSDLAAAQFPQHHFF